jgi:transposase
MQKRNSTVIEALRSEIGYEELSRKNAYLIEENRNLHQENEKLREIFRIATIEFEKKNKEVESLIQQIEQLRFSLKKIEEENALLNAKLEIAQGKIKVLNKIAFGKNTEKQQEQEKIVSGHKKRGAVSGHTGRGRKLPENLPEKQEVIDIPKDQQVCPNCGLPYKETTMEEPSMEIDVEPQYYYVKRYRRKIYKKTCRCPHQLVTAPRPDKIIPKSKFSLNFWVKLLLNKYKNHLPIERQVQEMKEYGLTVSSGTIFAGMKKIYLLYLSTLYQALIKSLRQAEHVHADESGWKIFVQIDEKGNYNWFIWVYVCPEVVVFVLEPGRSSEVPCKTLFDMDIQEAKLLENLPKEKKLLTVDKFSAYKTLEKLGLVELSYCWAHQRREFIQAKVKYPELAGWSDIWIKNIADIYHINNQRVKTEPQTASFREYYALLRKEISRIESLINQQYQHPAQISIMESMKTHWKGLTLFVSHPLIPMDNNISERMLRGPVLGRKNYWGNHSFWAGQLSVTMFSVIQSCFRNNISPNAYLTYYLSECAKKGSAPEEIDSFLPHKLTPDIRERLRVNKPETTTFGSDACLSVKVEDKQT